MREQNKKVPIECCTIDKTVVVRVEGRATFKQAAPLKDYFDQILKAGEEREIILDLSRCETLDSTFLGILAGMSSSMRKLDWAPISLVNMNATINRLVSIIGLNRVVDIYDPDKVPSGDSIECQALDNENNSMNKKEQILFMLDAHRQLLPLEEGNEMRFKNLMTCLDESLDKHKDVN